MRCLSDTPATWHIRVCLSQCRSNSMESEHCFTFCSSMGDFKAGTFDHSPPLTALERSMQEDLKKWGLKLYMAGMLNATQDFNSIATGWLMAIMCTNNECHFPTPENKKRPQFMTLCWQFVDNQLNFLLILCTMWVHLGIGSKVTCSVVLLQCWACHSVITNLKIIPCGWEFCMEHQQLPCNKLRWHRCKC